MDPDAFSASLFKWDPRGATAPSQRLLEAVAATPTTYVTSTRPPRDIGGLDVLFQAYGVRYYTAAKIAELGFTVSTLVDMKEEELDEMMSSLSQIFRWDLLVGERYGIKAAVRAERRRLLVEDEESRQRRHHFLLPPDATNVALDALSQEGLSEEPVQQEKEAMGSGGGGGGGGVTSAWEAAEKKKKQRRKKKVTWTKSTCTTGDEEEDGEEEGDGGEYEEEEKGRVERQREHPFIVTEPGEVARGKKNGIDYLFHLYEQCRDFLIHVQNISRERGEKCPTKVTNQVFRYAKKAGATYINKPKMRHYVHCYALHCLDEEASNALRRAFKEKGENVGAWRQACYQPLVAMAARHGWDIDSIFNSHPRLSIWYVPTKLRQLCHADRNIATATATSAAAALAGATPTCTAHHPSF
ncbi:floricaula/leafy homolog [Telopea speciosissima]|uniref:floricaula/leafy homolog n=1 Tax=Telopea speciosissima TaxID=54955 RepID=UPI001CC64B95|nr:floricaula/leafy homolog [Telopea speciosissima]